MITLRHRNPVSVRIALLAIAVSIVTAGLLGGAQAASANTVDCTGKQIPKAPKSIEVAYKFRCNEPITAFSLVSSIEIVEFSTVADVLQPNGQFAPGETFSCEGPIPGDGFGCSGKATKPNSVNGIVHIASGRCVKGKNQLRIWIVAVDAAGKASGPQPLQAAKCPKPKKKARGRN